MKRRDAVRTLAVAPLAAAFRWTPESVREAAARRARRSPGHPIRAEQFTAHEWETVRVLVDLIIPKDERSGAPPKPACRNSWTSMVGDDPDLQTPVRGGLAWLDHECDDRYGKTFVACTAGSAAGCSTPSPGRPRRSPSTPPAWRSSTASAT